MSNNIEFSSTEYTSAESFVDTKEANEIFFYNNSSGIIKIRVGDGGGYVDIEPYKGWGLGSDKPELKLKGRFAIDFNGVATPRCTVTWVYIK